MTEAIAALSAVAAAIAALCLYGWRSRQDGQNAEKLRQTQGALDEIRKANAARASVRPDGVQSDPDNLDRKL